jgi:hypothetical protein
MSRIGVFCILGLLLLHHLHHSVPETCGPVTKNTIHKKHFELPTVRYFYSLELSSTFPLLLVGGTNILILGIKPVVFYYSFLGF